MGDAPNGAETEVGQELSEAPLPKGDLFGKLGADVVSVEGGGLMAAVVEGSRQVLRWGVQCKVHGHAPGAKGVEQSGRRVCAQRK